MTEPASRGLARFRFFAITAMVAMILSANPSALAQKKYGPGVSDTEIKIGQTMPYSGPLSTAGTIGRAELAYFEMVNEHGGVNGRKITLISLDDGYNPAKTVEQVRKLVEQDHVLAIFDVVGTPTNAAIQRYLNDRKIPQLFAQSGGSRFDDPEHFPWTVPIATSYRDEGRLYGEYLLSKKPDAKVGVLHQDDDFGNDFFAGFKEGLGQRASVMVVRELTYAATDPTVDSQIVSLQSSGADAFLDATIAKFGAQAIRKAYDIGWKPIYFISNIATSIPAVLEPAGLNKSIGLISALYIKVPGDPRWASDPEYLAYLAFMKKYYPAGDPYDAFNAFGYAWAHALEYTIRKCGDDLTRKNLIFQVTHLHSVRVPMLLPGITFNTSPTDYRPVKQFVLHRFDGKQWVPITGIMQASASQ
jgi:branched-chain amino acid transport system substrate-binding protein